jgi:hypothetical protein
MEGEGYELKAVLSRDHAGPMAMKIANVGGRLCNLPPTAPKPARKNSGYAGS